jgi:hypothetical protein
MTIHADGNLDALRSEIQAARLSKMADVCYASIPLIAMIWINWPLALPLFPGPSAERPRSTWRDIIADPDRVQRTQKRSRGKAGCEEAGGGAFRPVVVGACGRR